MILYFVCGNLMKVVTMIADNKSKGDHFHAY